MDARRVIEDKRDSILSIAAIHKVRNLRVFGSVARGEAGPESDIDILVEPGPGCGLLEHAALERELTDLLGRKVDVVSEGALRPRVRERVLREATPL